MAISANTSALGSGAGACGHVERFLDGDQRVIDPLLCLVGRKLQPSTGAGAAILEGLDIGGLEGAVAFLQTCRQEIRDPGAAKGEGSGERTNPEAVAPAFGLAALAELIKAGLKVRRGLISHRQLLTYIALSSRIAQIASSPMRNVQ